ncbi:zearalenone hydrolase [Rhizodiscina lignyota]|uniref:Zearalenone hydrolase n=1 Tax=Rhizodiscina lignyota TaxID=1504668 RepID=A0A9P4MAB2_9PEZI|nr:zearalenone hydrolase [Rhizodiscina lignyota]
MRTRSTITTKDGITWYYEQEGSGPHVVLIPEGMGDCHMFDKPMSLIADNGFTVTTFDMPGMSRSSDAPTESYEEVTAQKLARYIVGLLDELRIDLATFWGSSSGGSTVLALASGYPDRVRNGMPHEVPTYDMEYLSALLKEDDETIARTLSELMPPVAADDTTVWHALGEETLARLWKNYPRWARGYLLTLPHSSPVGKEDLVKRPLDWSIGALSPTATFFDNIITAVKAGVSIGVIPGKHMPYLSDPEAFAKNVVDTTRKYL